MKRTDDSRAGTGAGTGVAQGKKRTTATDKLLEQAAKRKKEEKDNYVLDIMVRWRCQGENEGKACLRLPKENFCRPLRAETLTYWNNEVLAGNASVDIFPVHKLTLPLPAAGHRDAARKKKVSQSSSPIVLPPPQPQTIVISWPGAPATMPSPSTPNRIRQHSRMHSTPTVQSSPVHYDASVSAPELLARFIEWFTTRAITGLQDEAKADMVAKIEHVHKVLNEEYYDLGGVQRMDENGWRALGIKPGLGDRMRRSVSEFERSRRGL
jgi:hypothetical protein